MSHFPVNRPDDAAGDSRPRPAASNRLNRPRELPRYKLILQSGAVTDLMLVVRTIMELTHLGRAEATHKMWEAYHWGRSQLLVTVKERAELYVEQFAARGLTLTIEPA